MIRFGLIAIALALAACGQQQSQSPGESGAVVTPEESAGATSAETQLPPVDPALVAAPSTDFTAVEPTELGIVGAPTVLQALDPLLGPELTEGASLHLTVTENGGAAIADVVRSGMADDSVSAGQVRIEFRREEDGWYPTNAYRRSQCARGALAGQWTKELCP